MAPCFQVGEIRFNVPYETLYGSGKHCEVMRALLRSEGARLRAMREKTSARKRAASRPTRKRHRKRGPQ